MSRAHSSVRYASSVTGVDFEKYLVWGAIAAGVYFVAWPVLKTALSIKGAVGAGINTARDAVASGLYFLFGPTVRDETLFYTVRFPDGQNHAVPSMAVSRDGVFTNRNLAPNYAGDGRQYRIVIDKRKPTGVNKTAFPV